MAKIPALKKPAVIPTKPKITLVAAAPELKVSTSIVVFEVPMDMLVESPDNPNEQDEATFDQLVEGMKEGWKDDPAIVIPIENGPNKGKYIITSGHHRIKAAKVLGMKVAQCVLRTGWSDDKRKIELVRRNMLGGKLNPDKFTALYKELTTKYDAEVLKLQMGFTSSDAFKKVYKDIEKNLTPSQKKKLDESKEKITSVDGLSSVLNGIFKEHGSDLDHGFVVFNFAGKKHHYVECDSQLHKMMEKLEEEVRSGGLQMADVMKHLVSTADLSKIKSRAKDKT